MNYLHLGKFFIYAPGDDSIINNIKININETMNKTHIDKYNYIMNYNDLLYFKKNIFFEKIHHLSGEYILVPKLNMVVIIYLSFIIIKLKF